MHDITGNPDAGVVNPTLEELQKQPPSYLFEEQEAQLRKVLNNGTKYLETNLIIQYKQIRFLKQKVL
jgi:hypothetical protein